MLRNVLRQLLRTTAGYSLATLIGPIFTLVLTPIYTRLLGTANYGAVDTLTSLATVLYILGIAGLTSSLPVWYYDPAHESERPAILASTLWAATLWSAALALVVFLLAEPFSELALARRDLADLTRITAVGLPFGVIYGVQTVVLRLRFAVKRANTLALIYLLVDAATNILFVVILRWGARGVISANTATGVVMGLAGLAIVPESLKALPARPLLRNLVRAGLPLLPANLAVWLLMYEDRLFLVHDVSYEQIGIYSIANKLASMLSLLVEPFKSSWEPLSLSIQQQLNAPRAYSKVLTYFCVGGLGLGLGLSLFAHEILLIFATPAFVPAATYVWLLALVPLASGMHNIVNVGLKIEKRFGHISWPIAVGAGINTLLNIVLIPMLGVMGASIATAIGYLALPGLTAAIAQRIHPIPFDWSRVGRVFLVYGLLAAIALMIGSRAQPLSIALRMLLFLSYLPLLWLLRVFEPWEVQLALRTLRQPQTFLRWILERA